MTTKFLNNIDLNGTLTIAGSGGTNGYFLSTNGSGVISWAAASGGGAGFSGAGTSITGITGTNASGSTTVTSNSITFAPGSATTSSNVSSLSDNATGGDLTLTSGGAIFTGNSQGNATSGNLILDVGGFTSGGFGVGVLGNINIGLTRAQNVNIDANASLMGGFGSVNIGNSTGANINIGNSASNSTIAIGYNVAKQSSTTYIASSLGSSSIYTATLWLGYNNTNTTQIRIGTDSSTTSTTYLYGKIFDKQVNPTTTTTARLLTAAELLTLIVINSTATTGSLQLPTPANMDSNVHNLTDMAFDWSVINTAASGSVSVTLNGLHTVVGNMAVTFNTSARFRTKRAAATPAWVTYRIS